ncbi:hypothetical protein F5144DRAFT_70248 [Chaetomium tenue]|uniref:Uncharacterized protein n=1 Tax=Chaetomium tenue TaxID=1854479 RepID=A0ACB7PP34_9PEZI|nr:hypothetical protein F5144DRAFT_70248 [Chaetomium globosum]
MDSLTMPLSKDIQATATIDLKPCNDKGAVIDDISVSGSTEQNDNEAPTPSAIITAEAIDNPKVLPQTANEHQPETISKHVTETASLAEHVTRLDLKDEDDVRDILNGIIQALTIGEESECEKADLLPNSGVVSREARRASVSGDSSSTEQMPLAATELAMFRASSEADSGAICHADEKKHMESPMQTVAASSGTGTPPADAGPKQPEDQPEKHTAVPPSPTDNAGTAAANFEEFFKIQRSDLGGLGAFAARDLVRGQTILVESPLLRTTHFRLLPDYHNLSEAAKKAYLSLHDGENGDQFSKVERIKVLNSFFVPGGIAIFEIASRFNHACPSARNVEYVFDDEREVISFTICQDAVPAGAELFISYGGSPVELYSTYGFRCACGGCTPLTDEDIKRLKNRAFGTWDCDEKYDVSGW